ncbi:MAG: hypothetical protein LBI42_03985 [Chitinispirillales bacterium]|jgi:hypothetical protein|nr:hypothetical protein [Chitinispirillales bacterium]
MKAKDLAAALGLEVIQPIGDDKEVSAGYTSDLLSDVMANAKEENVLITIQAHINTMAVAAHTGSGAVIICNSRPIGDDMKEAAAKEEIALFKTEKNQFTISHLVYSLLNKEQ